MSLFGVSRYEGESKEEVKDQQPDHLSELLQRIEERKRQRTAANNKSDVAKSNLDKPKKKKRKLSNKEECSDAHNENKTNTETVNEQTDKVSSKKKKKKKLIHFNVAKENEKVEETDNGNLATDTENISEKKSAEKDENNFIILGAKAHKKQRGVKRVLPDWLAHPEVVSANLKNGSSFKELKSILDAKLIEVLKANGIKKLFPVQSSIIKWLHKCSIDRKLGLWPRDTCISAPTGSGKTLAYVLPIVQDLQTRLVPKIRCLVVLPVQELAAQVHKVMVTYTSHTNLKVSLLSSAFPFEQEQTNIIKKTENGDYLSLVDIVIATPGRLVDHVLKTDGFSLDSLKYLVIDEADRAGEWLQYLSAPHSQAPALTLETLLSSGTKPAQKLLFSATLSQDPEKLSRLSLFHPILFTTVVTDRDTDVNLDKLAGDFVGRYTSPGELTELAMECPLEYKPIILYRLLTRHDIISKTLVFTNSGHTAHRLALLMQLLLSEWKLPVAVGELSAQLTAKQRESILGKFASGDIHVLISTDALARGLDIADVQMVVSYDVPKHIKNYIHRAGRTGRAGKPGTAVSILAPNQIGMFKQMLNGAHKTVPEIERTESEELNATLNTVNYKRHIATLQKTLLIEKNENLERTKATKRRRATNLNKRFKM